MIFLSLFGLFCLCLYWFLALRVSYWYRQNIPFVPLKFPYIFGNISKGIHQALQFADFSKRYRTTDPIVGIYIMFVQAAVLIVDLDLSRSILVENFQHFQDRGMFYNEKDDPLSAIMGTLNHDKWKPIRKKLTTAFTPNKIKKMFPIVKRIGNELVNGLSSRVANENHVEIRDLFGRFTTDVIGTGNFLPILIITKNNKF